MIFRQGGEEGAPLAEKIRDVVFVGVPKQFFTNSRDEVISQENKDKTSNSRSLHNWGIVFGRDDDIIGKSLSLSVMLWRLKHCGSGCSKLDQVNNENSAFRDAALYQRKEKGCPKVKFTFDILNIFCHK